jgi:crossover junction endodeoxyribonuclease RusA
MAKQGKRQHTMRAKFRPIVKGRPRLGRRGRVFTPASTLEFEKKVAESWTKSKGPLFTGPLSVTIELGTDGFMVRVRSITHEASKLRGDVDNYAKSILDGLNGVAFEDDKQVYVLNVEKI